jgi:hypothetical protein
MKTTPKLSFFAGATLLAAMLAAGVIAACDSSSGVHETPPGSDSGGADTAAPLTDGGGTDGGTLPDGAPVDDCVKNPTTHLEIINACTDAAKFDKTPKLPLLLADGGLPALP